jgi:hypothetical protein
MIINGAVPVLRIQNILFLILDPGFENFLIPDLRSYVQGGQKRKMTFFLLTVS